MEDPLTRTHQDTIRALQQELEAVLSTLTEQLDVLKVFERGIQEQDDSLSLPNISSLRDSRQDHVLRSCKATVHARIDQFKALKSHISELGEWQSSQMDVNKDKQEAAIMVFTIVTIVFLPLSFVADVMGMNVADIRDMRFGQWLYWSIAVPLTVLVIGGSMWWAGALSHWKFNVGEFVGRFSRHRAHGTTNEESLIAGPATSSRNDGGEAPLAGRDALPYARKRTIPPLRGKEGH
jgi:Mg2+ and Co2+ transporter CorA